MEERTAASRTRSAEVLVAISVVACAALVSDSPRLPTLFASVSIALALAAITQSRVRGVVVPAALIILGTPSYWEA